MVSGFSAGAPAVRGAPRSARENGSFFRGVLAPRVGCKLGVGTMPKSAGPLPSSILCIPGGRAGPTRSIACWILGREPTKAPGSGEVCKGSVPSRELGTRSSFGGSGECSNSLPAKLRMDRVGSEHGSLEGAVRECTFLPDLRACLPKHQDSCGKGARDLKAKKKKNEEPDRGELPPSIGPRAGFCASPSFSLEVFSGNQ